MTRAATGILSQVKCITVEQAMVLHNDYLLYVV